MSVEITMTPDQEIKLKALLTSDDAMRKEIKQIVGERGGLGLLDTFARVIATINSDKRLKKAQEEIE